MNKLHDKIGDYIDLFIYCENRIKTLQNEINSYSNVYFSTLRTKNQAKVKNLLKVRKRILNRIATLSVKMVEFTKSYQ